MGTLLVYILKSAFCLTIFYLFYHWLISRELFYRFNRFGLLFLIALSYTLPLMQVTLEQPIEATKTVISLEDWFLLQLNDVSLAVEPSTSPTFSWANIILLVYLFGIVVVLIKHLYTFAQLLRMLHRGHREPMEHYLPQYDDINLVVIDEEITPFSWMNYVVISSTDLKHHPREILLHECAHIHYHHSWDILLADVCSLMQWFNPAAWLLKRELKTIHEYQADDSVLRAGIDARDYQMLLIKKAVGTRLYSMANNLNHNNLKKRIAMMKRKTNSWGLLKYAYVLPIAALALTAFARPSVQKTSEELSAVKVNDLTTMVQASGEKSITEVPIPGDILQQPDPIFEVVEETPTFPGGTDALLKYISGNLKYPAEAKAKGIQGRVTVLFVINKDGSVTDAEVVRKANPLLDAEALRVISSMPKWNPGKVKGQPVRVRYAMPINFKI